MSRFTVPGDRKVEPTEGKSFRGFCLLDVWAGEISFYL